MTTLREAHSTQRYSSDPAEGQGSPATGHATATARNSLPLSTPMPLGWFLSEQFSLLGQCFSHFHVNRITEGFVKTDSDSRGLAGGLTFCIVAGSWVLI